MKYFENLTSFKYLKSLDLISVLGLLKYADLKSTDSVSTENILRKGHGPHLFHFQSFNATKKFHILNWISLPSVTKLTHLENEEANLSLKTVQTETDP